ncbi:hypothetical protein KM295_03705 [Natronomonas sp. F2-12]|jgi:hypothetical protein|uniref:Uncharacterized protein n=1 Tax=Natronomonas aquatica TaxID=2841590 RepID=A0A9R1D5R4_9EURY|nr:hypothetical protein [Natronomonas aquatica]MCQ4332608.1 hypothetical protein [Natronomonas aquatica]
MPDPGTSADGEEDSVATEPTVAEAIRSTESYEAGDGVVFYDAENPLAWMQADNAVDLEDAA